MHIEVDQSGKVENTQTDTVLAFSDGKSYSIIIPARLKRKWFIHFGQKKKSKRESYLLLFSAGIFLLLKRYINRTTQIVIDKEYEGQEAKIKAMLLRYFQKAGIKITEDQIDFDQIDQPGKESRAHVLALSVFREREEAGCVIGEGELSKLAK